MSAVLTALGAALLVSLRAVLGRAVMVLVGRKVVEYFLMGSLRWLAKHTKSHVDDDLVELVAKELDGTSQESVKTCPNCGSDLQ